MSLRRSQTDIEKKPAVKCRLLSLAELCGELSVSVATGKNWLKSGRLRASEIRGGSPYFDEEYIKKLKEDMRNGENPALKKRRNKKYVSGNGIYNSYLPEDSLNVVSVEKLIEVVREKDIEINDCFIATVTADCAVQIISDKNGAKGSLEEYLTGKIKLFGLEFLVDEMLTGEELTIIKEYPELFKIRYIYEPSVDVLGQIYMSLKNIGSRKLAGAYYTPTSVVEKLIKEVFSGECNKRILDPCCGTGNFILNLPKDYDFKCVYCSDIDKMSVMLCRVNAALKFNVQDKQLIYSHISGLDYIFGERDSKFDIIIGNPPWGCDFSEKEKRILKKRYASACGSSVDSYEIFIERAFGELNPGGVLSFVLPESFLTVKSHEPIRKFLMTCSSINYLEYLGNIFDGVQCPSIIIKLTKTDKPFDCVGMTVKKDGDTYCVNIPRDIKDASFNFSVTDEEYELLKKIENTPGSITLKGKADFALGIVTGDNKRYISYIKTEENERIVNGSDLEPFRIKYADRFITFNGDTLQQVAPLKYYRAKEKLLYRFICDRLVFAYDDNGLLSLNSANILIPHIEGMDIKYIMAVLNSGVVQFFFKKTFHSVKVLRSHLERIPIPVPEDSIQASVITIVDEISEAEEKEIFLKNYDKLDDIISSLFGLTEKEFNRIKDFNKTKQGQ